MMLAVVLTVLWFVGIFVLVIVGEIGFLVALEHVNEFLKRLYGEK
jgi:hypothetical protein